MIKRILRFSQDGHLQTIEVSVKVEKAFELIRKTIGAAEVVDDAYCFLSLRIDSFPDDFSRAYSSAGTGLYKVDEAGRIV